MNERVTCDRTCPLANERWCRFNPILTAIGKYRAHSHTVRIRVALKDEAALKAAVLAMGGTFIGQGSHRIFDGSYLGLGFTLPGWSRALILQADGNLLYDDFSGRWGNPADIEKLKSEYTLATATQAAMNQGWMYERDGAKLTVWHPSGGHIVISQSGAEAFGFTGGLCHESLTQLGVTGDFTAKPEYSQIEAKVEQSCS